MDWLTKYVSQTEPPSLFKIFIEFWPIFTYFTDALNKVLILSHLYFLSIQKLTSDRPQTSS